MSTGRGYPGSSHPFANTPFPLVGGSGPPNYPHHTGSPAGFQSPRAGGPGPPNYPRHTSAPAGFQSPQAGGSVPPNYPHHTSPPAGFQSPQAGGSGPPNYPHHTSPPAGFQSPQAGGPGPPNYPHHTSPPAGFQSPQNRAPETILIYKNLLLLLRDIARTRNIPGFEQTLRQYHTTMCAPNPIIGVIRSPEYRKTLLQLAHNIDLTNDPRLREALRKDERRLQTTLVIVLQSQDHAGRAQTLRGNDAQNFMDVAQNMLRKDIPQENCAMARRIIRRLSEACNTLPSSIFITGVTNCDNHYSFGGGYADIYRASYKGQPVALKRLREHIQGEDPQIVRLKFCREALVWQNLKSPYVLSLIGIDSNTFSPSLCMVSPWMGGGTMLNHLNENGRGNVNKLLSEVAQGLLYLHSQNVVHGDLRGENILITPDWTACLTDFGLSLFSDLSGRPTTMGGNIRWMAPELIAPERFGLPFARTTASDVYAFGCVCIELYTGEPPFSSTSRSDAAVMRRVMDGFRPEKPTRMKERMWEQVNAYWAHQPAARPSTQTVVSNMT